MVWSDGNGSGFRHGSPLGIGGFFGAGFAETGGDDVVQLKENDEGDAEARVEETQSGSEGVERLGDQYAAADGGGNFAGQIVFDQGIARGVAPTL